MNKRISDEELARLTTLSNAAQNKAEWGTRILENIGTSDDDDAFFAGPIWELSDEDYDLLDAGGSFDQTSAFAKALLDAEYTLAMRNVFSSLLAEVCERRATTEAKAPRKNQLDRLRLDLKIAHHQAHSHTQHINMLENIIKLERRELNKLRAELEWSQDHACECPPPGCDCPGCSLSREETV